MGEHELNLISIAFVEVLKSAEHEFLMLYFSISLLLEISLKVVSIYNLHSSISFNRTHNL